MEFLIALIFILLIAGEGLFFFRIFRFSAHSSPLVAILLNTLILYLFGVNNSLAGGYRFVLILATLLSVAGFFFPRNFKLTNLFPLPIVAFILISLGAYFYTRGTFFYDTEEFTQWGIVYRYLMTVQAIPTSLGNVAVSVPPFSPLWQYFSSRFIGFEEANAYYGHMMALYAAILALFPVKSWRSWPKFLPAIAAALFSVFVASFSFQNLAVDLYLGLLFAAGLAQINLDGETPTSSTIAVCLIAVALVLTKSTGWLLALILIFIYAIALIHVWLVKKGSLLKYVGTIVSLFFLVAVPIAAHNNWNEFSQTINLDRVKFELVGSKTSPDESFPSDLNAYQQALQKNEDDLRFLKNVLLQPINTNITLQGVLESFSINAPKRTKMIAANFMDTFSNSPLGAGKVTQKWILLGALFLGVVNQVLLQKFSSLARNQNMIMNAALFLGFVIFAAALYLAYIFIFLPVEALSVPSLTSYLGSYTLAWWLVNLTVTFKIADSIELNTSVQIAQWITVAFTLGCLLYLPTSGYLHIPYQPNEARFDAEARYQKLSKAGLLPTDKVYDLWPLDPEEAAPWHMVMRYLLTPAGSNVEKYSLAHVNPDDGSYVEDLSPEQWIALLHYQNYTYVLVNPSDEPFWRTYNILFDFHPQDWEQSYLYRVTATGLQYVPLQ